MTEHLDARVTPVLPAPRASLDRPDRLEVPEQPEKLETQDLSAIRDRPDKRVQSANLDLEVNKELQDREAKGD